MDVRVTSTNYLVTLIEAASRIAGRLRDVDRDRVGAVAAQARRDAARLSARLDGSPLDPDTADQVDAGQWQRPDGVLAAADPGGGWAAALRIDRMETQEVAAVEYANLLDAYDAEPALAPQLFDDPLGTLAQLHGLMCQGLVEPDVVGRPRTTEQAIHDGAQGRVIFNTPDPPAIPALLDGLRDWLRGTKTEGSAAYSTPVVAAVVHEALLQWQPFEAANGRVARGAARLVLRARGFDPAGVAVLEHQWAADPGGYYGEVAATIRRRGDLTPWVERHTEALVDALERAATALDRPSTDEPSSRALTALDDVAPDGTITVAEYATRWNVSRETAAVDLRALAAAGLLRRDPRTLGRRFRRF
jgi:Fic family protein